MRHALAISEILHIRPWEQRELLTVPELQAACEYVDRVIKSKK
jgi:hypothetical protein